MNRKFWIGTCLSLILCLTILCGCGKDKNIESASTDTDTEIVQQEGAKEETSKDVPNENAESAPQEQESGTQFQYSMDDLSYADTVTGQKVQIGMTPEEIEAIAGKPISDIGTHCIYDGLIVEFKDKKATTIMVSGTLFTNEEQSTRFTTTRGAGVRTGHEFFAQEYPDLKNPGTVAETVSRYFAVSGDKVEYLGETLTDQMKSTYQDNLYIQEFLFDLESKEINSMRIAVVNN